jgi:quinolinate synthase
MAGKLENNVIVFCGVRFMAETAKILAPNKKVLTPYPNAGCLLADMINAEEIKRIKEQNNNARVISYVNTYADVKAESDIICTSANAKFVIESVDAEKIIFLPDRNLGSFYLKNNKKDVFIWNGYCPVHERITLKSIKRVKEKYPNAVVIAHPECPPEVTQSADFVGSTSQLIKYVENSDSNEIIVGTEEGTLHVMRQKAPEKLLLLPEPIPTCDQMKLITQERLLRCLQEEVYEIDVDEEIANKARKSIEAMLNL